MADVYSLVNGVVLMLCKACESSSIRYSRMQSGPIACLEVTTQSIADHKYLLGVPRNVMDSLRIRVRVSAKGTMNQSFTLAQLASLS